MSISKEGWKHISTKDLGNASGSCGLCGTRIRFVHEVRNEFTKDVLFIGCECAANIIAGNELDYIIEQDKAIRREASAKKREEERLRKNFEARNEFNLKHGIQPISWDAYLLSVEDTRKKNKEFAEKKEAQKRRRK